MIVTATELQNNFGKYINIMQSEPVIFTKSGKIIGKLSSVKGDKKAAFERLEQLKKGLHELEEDEKIYGKAEKFHV